VKEGVGNELPDEPATEHVRRRESEQTEDRHKATKAAAALTGEDEEFEEEYRDVDDDEPLDAGREVPAGGEAIAIVRFFAVLHSVLVSGPAEGGAVSPSCPSSRREVCVGPPILSVGSAHV